MLYIVEDNPWQAEQFTRVLSDAGYEVACFGSGIEAMAAIDAMQPQVIILDMLLAGTTGMALLHELQSYVDTGGIPVIVCSAQTDDLRQDMLASYGVGRILDKATMQPDDIITAVRSVV